VISRRNLRLTIALLLPLMVLRALLPSGYMPVAENGQLRIVLCSDGFTAPAGVQPASGSGEHHLPPNAGDCPFAHAAVNAPAVVLVFTAALPVAQFLTPAGVPPHLPLTTGPPRQHSARAPPTYS
jgi:hypothetical protein